MKKRFWATLLVVCFLILPCSAALDIPEPTYDFFVNDYADILSPSDRQLMQSEAENLYHACDAQVVVVTLPSLEGDDISDVSLKIARQWGIGDKEKDNGILLLFDAERQKVRIEVGSGLEGAIPDSKAGRLLDTYMLPAYPDYSTALQQTQSALINETYIEYGLSPDENYTPIDNYEQPRPFGWIQSIGTILLIIGAIVLFIRHPHLFWLLLHIAGRGGRGGRGGFSGGRGGFSGGGGGFSGGGAQR